jgi:hypothetical protein
LAFLKNTKYVATALKWRYILIKKTPFKKQTKKREMRHHRSFFFLFQSIFEPGWCALSSVDIYF